MELCKGPNAYAIEFWEFIVKCVFFFFLIINLRRAKEVRSEGSEVEK